MTKIKICGLKRAEDIRAVNAFKPDFGGFIINFPKSRRNCTPDQVAALVSGLDREAVKAVGVFVNSPCELIAEMLEGGVIDIAQLHGEESEEYITRLKKLTAKPVIKAFTVTGAEVLEEAAGSSADYILLDNGQGSGMSFNWSFISDQNLPGRRKWFLAGGLNENNISEAISVFHPFAVDLSGSVETDGVKDAEKIRRIIEIVRRIN